MATPAGNTTTGRPDDPPAHAASHETGAVKTAASGVVLANVAWSPALREALITARRRRAEQLIAVATSKASVLDVIRAAAEPGQAALMKIRLNQLLLAQPGWGPVRTRAALAHLAAITPPGEQTMTIGWLLDTRAGGRRFLAWLDTHQPKVTPWSGYPWSPRPAPQFVSPASTIAEDTAELSTGSAQHMDVPPGAGKTDFSGEAGESHG